MGTCTSSDDARPTTTISNTVHCTLEDVLFFLDAVVLPNLTNIVVSYLGRGQNEFDFGQAIESLHHKFNHLCELPIHHLGDKIQFCGVIDTGCCFQKCGLIWSLSGIERASFFVTTKPNTFTVHQRDASFAAFCARMQNDRELDVATRVQVPIEQQSLTVETYTIGQRKYYIILNHSDIGYRIHALQPLRFSA